MISFTEFAGSGKVYKQIWSLTENKHKGWECQYCGKTTKSENAMFNHIHKNHRNESFVKEFYGEAQIETH